MSIFLDFGFCFNQYIGNTNIKIGLTSVLFSNHTKNITFTDVASHSKSWKKYFSYCSTFKPYPWKKFHFLLIIGPRNTIFGNESPETHFKHHRGGPLTFQNYLLIGFGKNEKIPSTFYIYDGILLSAFSYIYDQQIFLIVRSKTLYNMNMAINCTHKYT